MYKNLTGLGSFAFEKDGEVIVISLYDPSGGDQSRAFDDVGVSGPWVEVARR